MRIPEDLTLHKFKGVGVGLKACVKLVVQHERFTVASCQTPDYTQHVQTHRLRGQGN